jgi:hypothetical protein
MTSTDTIGVDISKDHLDAHRMSDGANRRFANDKAGHGALVTWVGQREGTRISSSRPGLTIGPWRDGSRRRASHWSRSIRADLAVV